ncbi:MAG: ATP-binding cassette domain-containing protein [Anaerolineaceae bacterium]
MADPFLVVSHLSKKFFLRDRTKVQAVDDVSLSIFPGQIYGLVGPDGAGKTTTLRLICGAFKPEQGEVTLGNFSLAKEAEQVRSQIGYLSQQFSLYEDLTVMENIRFLAEVRGLSKNEWLARSLENLSFVGLEAFKDRMARQLSGGMKQKLSLACALVNRPRLLLLDEPTTGVDPVTRQDFWQLIIRLAGEQGLAVLVCTPYMDEASRCSMIGFLRSGKIIREGSPSQLRGLMRGRVLELLGKPMNLLTRIARAESAVQDSQRFGDRLHLRVAAGQSLPVQARLTEQIHSNGGLIEKLGEIEPLLEDVFIELAGSFAAGAETIAEESRT